MQHFSNQKKKFSNQKKNTENILLDTKINKNKFQDN